MPTQHIGTWSTTRYRNDAPDTPESIELTITEDTNPGNLDGAYARPGSNARLYGAVDTTGIVWSAQIDESGSSGDSGTAVFFVSADGNTLYGAWTSLMTGQGPQPWFGTRVALR
jgi:hypothetical protein